MFTRKAAAGASPPEKPTSHACPLSASCGSAVGLVRSEFQGTVHTGKHQHTFTPSPSHLHAGQVTSETQTESFRAQLLEMLKAMTSGL